MPWFQSILRAFLSVPWLLLIRLRIVVVWSDEWNRSMSSSRCHITVFRSFLCRSRKRLLWCPDKNTHVACTSGVQVQGRRLESDVNGVRSDVLGLGLGVDPKHMNWHRCYLRKVLVSLGLWIDYVDV